MSRLPLLLVLVLLSCTTVFGHFFGYDPYWQQRIAYNGAVAQQQQALGAQQVLIDQQNQANQQAIENQQQFDQQVGQQMDFQQQQIGISQQTQADAAQQTLQTAQQHQAVVFQQQQQAQLAAQQLAQAQAVVNQQKRQTQIVQAQAATAARQAAQAAAKTQQGLDAARQATAQLLAQQAAQAALPREEQQRSAALLHQIQLQKDQDIVNKEAAAKAAAMNSAMNLQQSQEQAKLAQFALDQQLRSANARARQAGTPVTAAAMDAIDTDTMPPETELDEADEAEFDVASITPAVVVKGAAAKPSGKPLVKPAVKRRDVHREYRDEYVDGTDLTHSELVSIIMSALEADNLPTAVTPEAKPAETELDEAGEAEFDVAAITPAAVALKSTATNSPPKKQTAKPHHDDDYQDEYVDGTDLTHSELVSIIMSALEADDVPTTVAPEAEVDSAFTVADPLTVNTARTAATDDKSTDASRQHTSLVIGVSVAGGSLLLILFLVYFGRSYYLARREKNELESARRAAQGNLPLPYGHPLQVI